MARRQPVRVVLADDQHAFVEGLGMVLSAEDDLEIVALAGDGASTLQAVRTHHPDVLVVDTEMPGPAVTELVRLVGQEEPATRVLLLAEDARPHPASADHAGMSRAASARELADAIRAVAAGFRVVAATPPAPRHPSSQYPSPQHASPPPRDGGAPDGRVAGSREGRSTLSTAPARPSGTCTPSCCCAACPGASARSSACWPAATPTAASPRPATCRSTRSAPMCRTCWSSWAYTPSWRRPHWPCARGWCRSRTTRPRRAVLPVFRGQVPGGGAHPGP